MASDTGDKKINLQLGDIIEFTSPSDSELHEKQFLIKYIDKTKIVGVGKSGEITININEDGNLSNESIIAILILSRAESPSYARQNGLVQDTWVDIYFGGEFPTIMTGQITSLDEDQIEIKLIDDETIYIDFAYRGIPEDIPIEKIFLRDRPSIPDPIKLPDLEVDESVKETTARDSIVSDEDDYEDDVKETIVPEFKERVKDILLSADQIQFGDKLGSVAMVVEVPDEERRFGIERQTTDLLNELLSDIPNTQRSQSVLNNIHRMIERFKQLRQQFSNFDQYGNASVPDIKGPDFKPLVESLEKLSHKLHWIIPVVRNTKKLYDIDDDVQTSYEDVNPETLAAVRTAETELIDLFKQGRIPDGQNGYEYLTKRISEFWTPFIKPIHGESIANVVIQSNISAIVDNLQDFYASVSQGDDIKRKRFLIQEYNLGLNTLESKRIKGGGTLVKIKPVTKPDEACVKSFITLPESTVTFSHINLPSSNILIKCNLSNNYLSYWRMLNNLSSVKIQPVSEDPIEFDEETYLKNICEYAPLEGADNYNEYLNKIVPRTRVLFKLINKHITDKLSIHAVLDYLEPFMIYQKDLSYKQYEEINSFISEKITEWKRTYIANRKNYEKRILKKTEPPKKPILFEQLSGNRENELMLVEGYGIDTMPYTLSSGEELIKLFNDVDYGRCFNDIVGLTSSSLMIPENSLEVLKRNTHIEESRKTQIDEAQQDKCKQRVLAKKYNALDEVFSDNGVDIKFDKKYDKTYYDVIDAYTEDLSIMTTNEERINFLTGKLQENVGMTKNDAERESEALLLKYKPVRDGDYAVATIGEDETYFYIRNDNKWVRDDSIPDTTAFEENSLFCNISDKCISINDTCDTFEKANLDFQQTTIDKMISEFDSSLTTSVKNLDKLLNDRSQNSQSRLKPLTLLKTRQMFNSDSKMYLHGLDAKEVVVVESPVNSLLGIILSQSDFIKKQNDISKFVSQYTRPAGPEEDQWWIYCNVSGVKLLPTFVSQLASVFVRGEKYFDALQIIMSKQGTEGGDGEAIIDKHTGWVITNIDFNTEEGYTEEGFVLRSRDIMIEDVGNAIAQAPTAVREKFLDPELEKILRVVRAISKVLGINCEHIEDFILGETSKLMARVMPSQAAYEKAASAALSKGKKTQTYGLVYNQTLILITSSFLLFGIQTSIPSIKTKKTQPGCIKSFSGYPSFGDGDKSGIVYIACAVNSLKSSIEPWDSIKSISKNIVAKMEAIINKFILSSDVIQQRIRDKNEYNLVKEVEYVPEEHDISNWINFLPPLRPVKVVVIAPSKEFREQFVTEIKKGHKGQFDTMNALRSKIIFISLSIESSIQKVVNTNISEHRTILSNSSNVPFLENACCNDSNDDTYTYFSSREPNINLDNELVREIRSIIDDANSISKAPILFDPSDTRSPHTPLGTEFSEATIYKAFINLCNYNSKLPISESVKEICMDKPDDFNNDDTIEEKIIKLKRDGRNFDNVSLSNLITIINRQNLVKLDLTKLELTSIQMLRGNIESLKLSEQIFPIEFIDLFIELFDDTELLEGGESPLVRKMKVYLSEQGEHLHRELNKFIIKNTDSKTQKSFLTCINKILGVETLHSNNSYIYSDETFMKNAISMIANVFPNIIINKVIYDPINIPACWNLSDIHQIDLKNHAAGHFNSLVQFYDDAELNKLLELFQHSANIILNIAKHTSYSPNSMFDERLTHLLFRFYILSIFGSLMKLADSDIFYEASSKRPSNAMLGAVELIEVSVSSDGTMMSDMIDGNKKLMSEKIAKMISVFADMTCIDKKITDMSYEDLMDKVTRSKEKERDLMVEYLTDLTDSEREIENMFKNFRMGKWSVGMQKGYKKYDTDTYDKERDDIEKRTMLETRLKKVDGVTEGLMDMFAIDAIMEADENDRVEQEELGLEDYAGEDEAVRDEDFGDEQ
jgi:hypothetical protein